MPPRRACGMFTVCFGSQSKTDEEVPLSGPSGTGTGSGSGTADGSSSSGEDPLLWSWDIEKHFLGEFSFAVVQGNSNLEDYSQVETGRNATFVGIYDGHGGRQGSSFVSNYLFDHLINYACETESRNITEDVIRRAFSATESGFLEEVAGTFANNPDSAAVGSCCLVGIVQSGTLYVAQLGDSRAVIGYTGRSNNIIAQQLTREHNADKEEVRLELQTAHPYDPQIVVLKNSAWRVKGVLCVSRSIGDAYMKSPDFEITTNPRFKFDRSIRDPVVTAVPSIYTRVLQPNDKFLIFASDGLWDLLTNEEAAAIVHEHPRRGIAKRLIQTAQKKVATARNITFEDLKRVESGERRTYHDDISVVVLYLDQTETLLQPVPEISVRNSADTAWGSKFSLLRERASSSGIESSTT